MATLDGAVSPMVAAERAGAELLSAGDMLGADSVLRPWAGQSHVAAARLGVGHVLRQVLSGDKRMADEGLRRLALAETMCGKQSATSAADFARLAAGKRSLLQRLGVRSSFAHPWCEGTQSEALSEEAQAALGEWRRAEGLLALTYTLKAVLLFSKHGFVKGSLALRSSWLICRSVGSEPNADDDASQFAQLTKGVFQVMLSNMPPFLQRVFSVIGFESNRPLGLRFLRACTKATDFEPRTLGTVILALHHLMLSQQEYNSNVRVHIQASLSLVDGELARRSDSVLAKLIKSHIIRRQGRIEEAMAMLDQLAPLVEEQVAGVEGGDFHAYRLVFDRALLYFVTQRFGSAADLLDCLVEPESSFGARVLATAVAASCHALKEDPDHERCRHLLEGMGVGHDLGRMDQSILLKKTTLLARPHQGLLGFEILYIFGHLKCYSPSVAANSETSAEWLRERRDQVRAIAERPGCSLDDMQALHLRAADDMPAAEDVEEVLVCALIEANISALLDELDMAETLLRGVLEATDDAQMRAVLKDKDQYVAPWALYELAAVKLRRGEFSAAKPMLDKAQKQAKDGKKPFSFAHMLAYKCAGALKECSAAAKKRGSTTSEQYKRSVRSSTSTAASVRSLD